MSLSHEYLSLDDVNEAKDKANETVKAESLNNVEKPVTGPRNADE